MCTLHIFGGLELICEPFYFQNKEHDIAIHVLMQTVVAALDNEHFAKEFFAVFIGLQFSLKCSIFPHPMGTPQVNYNVKYNVLSYPYCSLRAHRKPHCSSCSHI